MHITDPIADMLTRIRNANNARHESVDIPASKMKKAIADILVVKDMLRVPRLLTTAYRELSALHLSTQRTSKRY